MLSGNRAGYLTLRQLQIFEAVARLGSVTRAAAALHLTQPAVSIQMKSLAEAVGRALTEPAGRGLRLTQAGRDLHETCRELAAAWSRFEARLDDGADPRRVMSAMLERVPARRVELRRATLEDVFVHLVDPVDSEDVLRAMLAGAPGGMQEVNADA